MATKKFTNRIALFEAKKIRKILFKDEWWFSIIDIVQILTQQPDYQTARKYWNKLQSRLKKEGSQSVTYCHRLKFMAKDGKYYLTDAANTQTLLRLIQSIPSPKAEPLKQWLAQVGQERINEIENPELAMERMKAIYEKKGYPQDWVDKRIRGIAVRQGLTDEWKNRGAKIGIEYAILTNEIMANTFGLKVDEYKKIKKLSSKNNLRDHMDDIELILTMLAEATTTKLHQDKNSVGFPKLIKDAKEGGSVAGRTRKDIEDVTGKKVITPKNYLK